MSRSSWSVIPVVAFAIAASSASLRAETVELANGELLRGTVISLDAKELKFKSESLGDVTIDRAKVSMILLTHILPPSYSPRPKIDPPRTLIPGSDGDVPPAADTRPTLSRPAGPKVIVDPPKTPIPPGATSGQPSSVEDLLKQLQGGAGGKPVSPDDLLKQLEGGNSPELEEIQKNLPLLAAPEVQGYFRKQVGGLIDGSITVNDIRKEAIRARDETKAAVKDLGPDAEAALAPYLGILERFIRETEPKSAPTPNPQPIPPALQPK